MKINKKIELGFDMFKDAALYQLKQNWTWGAGLILGVYQGLKYKGDFKTGLLTGLTVVGVIAATNGISNVFANMDEIKEA